ncbi:MAG: TetR/AcrR family transcriptional regulator [Paracoccaceae bacterium]|nr:TetR/AcrR family transcriptional regulator [Paracoccaceae bacterium]
MTNRKHHDPAEFIDRAMHAFWAGGFDGTSIGDLVAATGVNRGSIYASFDGKRDLFTATLHRYDDLHRARFLERLRRQHPAREAVLAAFTVAASTPQGDTPAGCLLVNTAVELAPHDVEIAALIGQSLSKVETFFQDCLTEAGHPAPEPTAKALLALFLGLRVLTRAQAPRTTRDAIVDQAKAMMD